MYICMYIPFFGLLPLSGVATVARTTDLAHVYTPDIYIYIYSQTPKNRRNTGYTVKKISFTEQNYKTVINKQGNLNVNH